VYIFVVPFSRFTDIIIISQLSLILLTDICYIGFLVRILSDSFINCVILGQYVLLRRLTFCHEIIRFKLIINLQMRSHEVSIDIVERTIV